MSLGLNSRWRTPIRGRRTSPRPEPRFPLDLVRCPTARSCRSPNRAARACCFATTSICRRTRRRCCEHARVAGRAPDRRARARRPTASPSRSRATTAISCSTTCAPACPCSASSRRATSPRSPSASAASHGRRVLRRRAGGASCAATGARPTSSTRNNVLAHVADLNGFVEGFRCCSPTTACSSSESPYLGTFVRARRVRHDLSRAPLLLLADRARPPVPPPRPRHRGLRAARDPRRLAAHLRPSRRRWRPRRAARRARCSRRRRRLGRRRREPYRASPAGVERVRDASRRARARAARRRARVSPPTAPRPRGRCCSTPAGLGRDDIDVRLRQEPAQAGPPDAGRARPIVAADGAR